MVVGLPCRCGTRRGACPVGRLLTLPSRRPQGGLPSLPPVNPAFSLLSFPHPPAPLPSGKGEIFSFLMQGASPLASPRPEPARHLLSLPRGRGPSQTPPSLATDSSISPGPPSPWLPALPMERRFFRFCAGLEIPKAHPRRAPQRKGQLATNRDKPPPGAWFAPFPSAARVQPRGCKGRSPLHKITLKLPLPHRGRGSGGWGKASKLKAG